MTTDYNEYYNFILEDPIWESASETYVWYQKKNLVIKYLKDILKYNPSPKILDIGCNIGKDLFMTNKKLKNDKIMYTGVDISKKAIQYAKRYAKREKLNNFKFYIKDLLKDDLKDLGNFDIIICSEFIEHLPDHNILFNRFYDLLDKNGHMILTTPDKGSLFKKLILKMFPDIKDYQSWYFDRRGNKIKKEKDDYMVKNNSLGQHISEVTKKELSIELKNSNFKIIRMKSSAVSYGSPVLDDNKLIFLTWIFIDCFFPFNSHFGYDSCVLAQKI